MRMRPHVHALAGHELHRAEMVEEDEGADHLALAVRQRAAHLESVAEVAGARHDDQFERVAGAGIAKYGVVGGKPAHDVLRSSFGHHSSNWLGPSKCGRNNLSVV